MKIKSTLLLLLLFADQNIMSYPAKAEQLRISDYCKEEPDFLEKNFKKK